MSSRFLKKVSDRYESSKAKSDLPVEDESPDENTNNSYNISNKFSLLLSDSTESDEIKESEEIEVDNKKTQKPKINKPSLKKKVHKDKYINMTEDEMLEMFRSSETKSINKEVTKQTVDILSLKIRNLNENIELQQLFGRQADEPNVPQNSRVRQRNPNPISKFTFGKRNANWPNVSFNKLGLKMEQIDNDNRNESNNKWCFVSCSNEYLQAEISLREAMRSGTYPDHLRNYPYHLNTLLQMGAILDQQEDFSSAADLWKRVFYVYETIAPLGMSLLGSTSVSGDGLNKAKFMLDYRFRLNRPIFIALFQWILYLGRKSCFNTALEYCKLLLSLNITGDPLAIILLLDDIAIRCDQFDFLINFYNQFLSKKSLKYLPNFAFSVAISFFFKSSSRSKDSAENDGDLLKSDEALQEALGLFPTFLRRYIDLCSVQIDERIRSSAFFFSSSNDDPSSLDCLIDLYTKRSINFWKNSDVLGWLERNARAILHKLETPSIASSLLAERKRVVEMYNRELPLSIKRHQALADHRQSVFVASSSSLFSIDGSYFVFDPFPPVNSEGGLDHYTATESQAPLNDSWLMNLLRSLSPSYNI